MCNKRAKIVTLGSVNTNVTTSDDGDSNGGATSCQETQK